MSSTLDELRSLIQTLFDIDPSGLDPARPVFEYGLDSLALTEFLFAAEDHFGVDLSDRAEAITTLAGLAAFVDRKRAVVLPAAIGTISPAGE